MYVESHSRLSLQHAHVTSTARQPVQRNVTHRPIFRLSWSGIFRDSRNTLAEIFWKYLCTTWKIISTLVFFAKETDGLWKVGADSTTNQPKNPSKPSSDFPRKSPQSVSRITRQMFRSRFEKFERRIVLKLTGP